MTREDLELYVMGIYDGDVAALERELAADPAARAIVADEARLDLLLRDAAAAATFCPVCDDLVRGARCDACGAAVRPGGYTIERVLVSNAHGRMYAARDVDGRQVALKELAFVQSPGADALAAFEREARFLRALEHPAIPRFCASFQEDAGVHARYYLAQELVVGEALDDRLETHWFSEAEIIDIARQVLDVLVYLQGLSPMVIHRDIKPANLLLRPDGTIAIVDFGAAHVHGMTVGTTAIGTFGYMPIEQLAGDVDATTDLYALGASLIHLLTRREPWRLLQDGLLADVVLNVGRPLRAFLARLVAPNPRDRFRAAADARAALDRLQPSRRSLDVAQVGRRALGGLRLRWPRAALVPVIAGAVVVTGVGARVASRVHHRRQEVAAKANGFAMRTDTPGGAGTPQAVFTELTTEACRCTTRRCADTVIARLSAWSHDSAASPEWLDPEVVHQVTAQSRQLSGCLTRVMTEAMTPDGIINVSGGPDKLVDIPRGGVRITAAHDAVQAIGQACDINVVLSGQITSELTGTLSPVRCDRALDILLRPTGLDYEVRDAGIVRVGRRAELVAERAARADRTRRGITDDRLPAGRNVDLDFRQIPVRDLILLLAGFGGVQATLPDRLGTITAHLTHVPWDRALVAVLDASGLGYRYQDAGRRLRIAAIAEIDTERQRATPHGLLEVHCPSCTRFAIDGADTPLPTRALELSPGTHTITLFKGDDKTTWLIDVKPGITTRVGDPPFDD